MNRRDLFKFAAASAGVLLLPEYVAKTSYFLAPRGGWLAPNAFVMRRVEQYMISRDELWTRYDVLMTRGDGYHCQFEASLVNGRDDALARKALANRIYEEGWAYDKDATLRLSLPRGAVSAEFV